MSEKGSLYRLGLKYETMRHYSGGVPRCADCGSHDLHVLQLDHSNNNGKEHREQLISAGMHPYNTTGIPFYQYLRKCGYPDDLGIQVLCSECNNKKPKPTNRAVKLTLTIEFSSVEPIPYAQAQPLWEVV